VEADEREEATRELGPRRPPHLPVDLEVVLPVAAVRALEPGEGIVREEGRRGLQALPSSESL
jgi:hypothetical protein